MSKVNLKHIILHDFYDFFVPSSAMAGRYLYNVRALQISAVVESSLIEAEQTFPLIGESQNTSMAEGRLLSLMHKY